MQFDRFIKQIGIDNFNKIKSVNILVIGLGGVGSYVVESLVRSGVNNLTIVDFDKIDITNLNRQVMTNLENINKLKTDEIELRARLINKDINIKKINEFINSENINLLYEDNYDYIIDCCDSVDTKKAIIKNCINKKLKFITCMGTGNKLDPSKLEIIDIRKTTYDPLAKKIRKWIKDERIKGKVLCISSTEKPIDTNDNIITSNSFVPASAGLLITSCIIRDIIK